jgi:Ca2+-binding EF-hand superfamily protein
MADLAAKRAAAIAAKEAARADRNRSINHTKTANAAARAAQQQTRSDQDAKRAAANEKRESALRSKANASNGGSSKYAKADVLLLKKVFDDYDKDGEGSIDIDELKQSLRQQKLDQQRRARLGSQHDRKQTTGVHLVDLVESLFHEMDRDHSGYVSFSEMLQTMYPLATDEELKRMLSWAPPKVEVAKAKAVEKKRITPEKEREAREIFDSYDQKGDGMLDYEELREAMASFLSRAEIDKLIGEADANGDKMISFDEFVATMMPAD